MAYVKISDPKIIVLNVNRIMKLSITFILSKLLTTNFFKRYSM